MVPNQISTSRTILLACIHLTAWSSHVRRDHWVSSILKSLCHLLPWHPYHHSVLDWRGNEEIGETVQQHHDPGGGVWNIVRRKKDLCSQGLTMTILKVLWVQLPLKINILVSSIDFHLDFNLSMQEMFLRSGWDMNWRKDPYTCWTMSAIVSFVH